MSRVIVIGAGLGGLATAALLAANGHQVSIFEQAPHVGGKLGRHDEQGLMFDTGPSLLTLPQILRDVFERTGGWPGSLELQGLSPIAHIRFTDGTGFDVGPDVEAFCAALDQWSPGSGSDWRRFRSHAARIWDLTHEPFLESELRGARTLVSLALRQPRASLTIAPWRTLHALAKSYLRDPRLRQFVGRYATYTGSDPRRAPAALATIPYAEHEFGGWYVRGGLTKIGDALTSRAVELGVTINLNCSVREVAVSGGRTTGIELANGEQVHADIVVSNVDARQLYGELVTDSRAWRRLSHRRLRSWFQQRAPRSYSGFVLLLGIRGTRPPDLASHTVLFAADPTAEFDELRQGVPVSDPTIYLSTPADDAVASPHAYPMFVLVNAPRQDQFDWTATVSGSGKTIADAYADQLLDLMATRGFDVRDRIAFRSVRTPADLERETGAPGGSIYGSSSDGPRSAFLRPSNKSKIDGLYLVGGSAHPGGGIPLVLLSAQIVADLIEAPNSAAS